MSFDFPSSPTEGQLYQAKGQPTYKYVSPAWRVIDSGVPFIDEAAAVFAAMSPQPDAARKNLIEDTIKSLKTANVWAKLDGLYVQAAHASQPGLVNWVKPANVATVVNAPTHVVDRGFVLSATGYTDSGFNPVTATPAAKFVQNSASMFGWGGGVISSDSSYLVSQHDGRLTAKNTYNDAITFVINGGGQNYNNPGDAEGFLSTTRSSASTMELYKDGAAFGAQLTGITSSAVVSANFFSGVNFALGGTYAGALICIFGFGQSLTAGEHAALYTALNTYMAAINPNLAYAYESERIFNAFTTPPVATRKLAIDTLVRSLAKSTGGGVWNKQDTLYAFAAADSQASLINLRNPGSYTGTLVNAPIFAPDQGYYGAATKSLDSNFNLLTAPGRKFVQDSAHAFAYSLQSAWADGGIFGNSSSWVNLVPRGASHYTYFRLNNSGESSAYFGDGYGLWSLNRSAAAAFDAYRDGVVFQSPASASAAVTNSNMLFLTRGGGHAFLGGPVAFGGFGSTLAAGEQVTLYNALKAYLNTVAYIAVNAETDAIIAKFARPASPARKKAIDDFITATKTAGIWAKLDIVYFYAASDSIGARTNWKDPNAFTGVEVNTPYFYVDIGFSGDNFGKQVDTTWIPATHGVQYQQNSASAHVWVWSRYRNDGSLDFQAGGTPNAHLVSWNGSQDTLGHSLNDSTGANAFSPAGDNTGLISLSRTSSANYTVTKNNVVLGTQANVSTGRPTASMKAPWAWARYLSFFGMASGLTGAENTSLFNAVTGYLASVQTEMIVKNFTVPPTAARRALIESCILALMRAGVWAKFDALYLYAAADSQAALFNWKNPTIFNGTLVNAPPFTVDRGFSSSGGKYIDSTFNPTTAGWPNYVQNDAHVSGWSLTDTDSGTYMIFQGSFTNLGQRNAGVLYAALNSGQPGLANTNALGHWTLSRQTISTNLNVYKNGAVFAAPAAATVAPENANIIFAHGWPGTIAAGSIGGGLTAAESLAYYNAINTYVASTRIFSAFTTPPTEARQLLIQNCVRSLITAGVWDKLDFLHVFAAADIQASSINWKNPGTYDATGINSPQFTANRGVTIINAAALSTGFDPTTAPAPKWVLDNASNFGWALNNVAVDGPICGNWQGWHTTLGPRNTANNAFYSIQRGTSAENFANTDGIGFWAMSRVNAGGGIALYKNGALAHQGTLGRDGMPAISMNYGQAGGSNYWINGQIAFGGAGAGLTLAEHTALYNALRTYGTGVGIP